MNLSWRSLHGGLPNHSVIRITRSPTLSYALHVKNVKQQQIYLDICTTKISKQDNHVFVIFLIFVWISRDLVVAQLAHTTCRTPNHALSG
jgi:hypothetical protein